ASTEELCRIQEGRQNRINRLEMMKFNKISKQHLNNLIKYFATDVQELLQISKDQKTNLNDEGKPIQKKEFYDRQYPEQYKEADQELTEEEMIKIATMISDDKDNWEVYLDYSEYENEIETDKKKDKENQGQEMPELEMLLLAQKLSLQNGEKISEKDQGKDKGKKKKRKKKKKKCKKKKRKI
ncbi:MAG: hypothetical protein EZS28_020032, partial [Streblomastix strix]